MTDYLAGLVRKQLSAEAVVLRLSTLGIPMWEESRDGRDS